MDAHERPGSTDAALERILQQLQDVGLRMADEWLAEQASFKKQMSAFQNGKDMRQTRRKAIQEELQELDEQDKTDNDKATRLQREYDDVTEQRRRNQQTLQDRLAAISSQMVRIHLRFSLR